MAQPVAVNILSDDDDDDCNYDAVSTPVKPQPKRQRGEYFNSNPTFVVIDDDPTPFKPRPTAAADTSATPSFVPETPMSDGISIVKCTSRVPQPQFRVSPGPDFEPYRDGGVICLGSDDESERVSASKTCKQKETASSADVTKGLTFDTGIDDDSLQMFDTRIDDSLQMFDSRIDDSLEMFDTRIDDSLEMFEDDQLNPILTEDNIAQVQNQSNFASKSWNQKETASSAHFTKSLEFDSRIDDDNSSPLEMSENVPLHPVLSEDDIAQVQNPSNLEIDIVPKKDKKGNVEAGKKGLSKEEKLRLMEEKKRKKEEEKLRKLALQAEAAEMKKLQKDKQKWEKGKFALKSIVAEIDTKVIELSAVGGHLLTRLAEKGITYRITKNPIERSIVWSLPVPDEISQLSSEGYQIPYVLVVYEAEEFCNLVRNNDSLTRHASRVQTLYPSHTICYLTNKLMSYINKREQSHYKDPTSSWRRPPVEEVMSKLTTRFCRVHSRQCIDEAELAEHVVGLTCSLASCQFRTKLTRLSVNANGSLIPKDCFDKTIIKKSPWLKALLAIPKVQPRFALAIWKKYPTMKSLLTVYMDSTKTVHEKEFLLKDLPTEGLLGEDRKLGEICSKRVYRILTAKHGLIKTDEVEDGADCFSP